LHRELPNELLEHASVPLHVLCAELVTGTEVGLAPVSVSAMLAITLIFARQLRVDFDRHSTALQMHIALPLCLLSQSAYDYSNGADLIALARISTRAWIREGGLSRAEFPRLLNIHTH
jgi:hypothetical protein